MVTVVDNPARQSFVSEMVGPAPAAQRGQPELGELPVRPADRPRRRRCPDHHGRQRLGVPAQRPVLPRPAHRPAADAHARTARRRRAPRGKGQLREGLRYVRGRPELIWPIVLVGFVGTFGFNFPIWLTAYADEIFHGGAGMYSLFNILMAAGSLAGALLAARRRSTRLRMLVAAGTAFGAPGDRRGRRPVRLALLAPAGPDRHDRPDDQHHREHERPDGRRPGHAGPGDEPVHDGLRRRYAGGRPDRRLDQRHVRRPDRLRGRRRVSADRRRSPSASCWPASAACA